MRRKRCSRRRARKNYYPACSPDGAFVIFNRVPLSGTVGACTANSCPNDAFSNPSARIFLDRSACRRRPASQDPKSHNHIAQWVVQLVGPPTMGDMGTCVPDNTPCTPTGNQCCNGICCSNGTCGCIP